MPYANEKFDTDDPDVLLRLLLYGPEKSKKTWLACAAAEAGFNVILLDCDDGAHILKQLTHEARKRIFHLNIIDMIERPVAAEFLARFMSGKKFIWDETDKTVCLTKKALKDAHKYIECDISNLTKYDVLILDSWTKVTNSLVWRWYYENNVDISSGDHVRSSDWPGYRWCGALASYFLRQCQAVKSHSIVIGHQTVYEKHKKVNVGGKEQDTIEWSRTQIKSTSGPHALTVGTDFSDILRFYFVGDVVKITTVAEQDLLGGTRLIPPKKYNWKELQFSNICGMIGIPLPVDAPPQTALAPIDVEEVKKELEKTATNSSSGLIKPQTGTKAKGSFSDLMRKPKGEK